jgi:hypothetical protein
LHGKAITISYSFTLSEKYRNNQVFPERKYSGKNRQNITLLMLPSAIRTGSTTPEKKI